MDKEIEELLQSYSGSEREIMAELLETEDENVLVRNSPDNTSGTEETN
jgi:hypothetical protein